MLQLTSTGAVVDQIAHARRIAAEAYTLHGPVLFALEDAARRGACVRVRLEGRPFDDPKGRLAAENAGLAGELRACGAKRRWRIRSMPKRSISTASSISTRRTGSATIWCFAKAMRPKRGGVATIKHEALAREAQLLGDSRRGDDAVVESESFGCCNAVYGALSKLARERRLAAPVGRATRTARQQTRSRSS